MSWKRTIRPAADRVAKYSGLLRACEWGMRSSLTVLMYHRVLDDADCADYPFRSLVMPRSAFEAQVAYLAEHARVLPVFEALRDIDDQKRDSKPRLCLTFDDGYVDNFEIVAPLLEAKGLRGTFYITAGAVKDRRPLWYDRAVDLWGLLSVAKIRAASIQSGDPEQPPFDTRQSWIEWLKRLPHEQRGAIMTSLESEAMGSDLSCPLMTESQVRELSERGHEIGSHTLSHPILTTMAEDERRDEIQGAKQLLEAWTAQEVPGFCYPNGDFDAAVVRQLREAGHGYACTTSPGRNRASTDPFELRRIDMTQDRVRGADGRFDSLGFRAEISMLHEALRRLSAPRKWRVA